MEWSLTTVVVAVVEAAAENGGFVGATGGIFKHTMLQ